jgi:hypothetical protein
MPNKALFVAEMYLKMGRVNEALSETLSVYLYRLKLGKSILCGKKISVNKTHQR